jgi:dienelactone hydrolase
MRSWLLALIGTGMLNSPSQQNTAGILPWPSGPRPIGRTTYHWIDSSRKETHAEGTGYREVMVDVWYPARIGPTYARAIYLPNLSTLERSLPRDELAKEFAPAYDALQRGDLRTHAQQDVPAYCARPGCPLLVFSHGGGVDRSFYTAQYEDLASHGYVVAAIAHTYLTHALVFPEGRVVRLAKRPRPVFSPDSSYPIWRQEGDANLAYVRARAEIGAADVRFVVNQVIRYAGNPFLRAPFLGQVDSRRIGALGHSAGGHTAVRACQTDPRIKACMNQDGIVQNLPIVRDSAGQTMKQPFMYFGRVELPPPPLTEEEMSRYQMTQAQGDSLVRVRPLEQVAVIADNAAGAWRVRLAATDATHMSFSDEILINAFGDSAKTASALRDLRLVQRYTRAFFDYTLRRSPATPLERPIQSDTSFIVIERYPPKS